MYTSYWNWQKQTHCFTLFANNTAAVFLLVVKIVATHWCYYTCPSSCHHWSPQSSRNWYGSNQMRWAGKNWTRRNTENTLGSILPRIWKNMGDILLENILIKMKFFVPISPVSSCLTPLGGISPMGHIPKVS